MQRHPYPAIPAAAPGLPAGAAGARLLGLPATIARYQPPRPAVAVATALPAVRACLNTLLLVLSGYRAGALPQVVDLRGLAPEALRLVAETLGVGEVSATVTGARPAVIDETRLAGVWRVREAATGNRPGRDVLEVAALPGQLCVGACRNAADRVPIPATLPAGVMNAPGILAELNALVAARTGEEGPPAAVINLTLLPMAERDQAFLEQQLGSGPVRILSRGYGNCHIQSTGLRQVWWVRHCNSEDRLILNTLEVTDCPGAALATQQDIEDSAVRLAEILEALDADG